MNIWIPVTPTYGSNTLYAESSPGANDFEPFVCQPGEAVKFWGNQCLHHTVPNTETATRISFDLRVIQKSKYNTKFVDRRGKVPGFVVPHYYMDSSVSDDVFL